MFLLGLVLLQRVDLEFRGDGPGLDQRHDAVRLDGPIGDREFAFQSPTRELAVPLSELRGIGRYAGTISLTIVGLPIGFWMFDQVPALVSLRR